MSIPLTIDSAELRRLQYIEGSARWALQHRADPRWLDELAEELESERPWEKVGPGGAVAWGEVPEPPFAGLRTKRR